MENIFFGIIVIMLLGIIFYLSKNKNSSPKDGDSSLLLQQLNNLSNTLDQKLRETERQVNESIRYQAGESQKIIREITRELTEVKETGKQVVGFAEQLESLQDILKNPKQRGILGEYYLETVLKNVLPPSSYQVQYGFKDGTIVDAVVFVKDKIIPIDSKFSLENYNRLVEEKDKSRREELEKQFKNDLKLRIDETSKYVKPSEGTMDFAFMFIPHEAIYYDLLVAQVGGIKVNTRDLIDYAFKEKKVIIVSPTSFLAFLQTVLQGLKALEIEERAQEIIKRVEDLGKHLKAYEDYHNKLGNTLSTAVNHYNSSGKELKKVDKDVLRIAGASSDIEPVLLDERVDRE
ncbi:DNA recombination protein RmuC [Candidatus Nomurabacteria bacterium]|nr:DNA recombination protein RmuC [Candidatus Nomurabacteria bacterium]USN94897.1 MAG: DNA recombination protein RmuC [Candidatus Nomurabacteria bacterium]